MAKNRLSIAWDALTNPQRYTQNKLYEAVFRLLGGQTNTYNSDLTTLLVRGYGENPDVNAMVNQMASKSTVVPFYVKKIKDEKKLNLVKSYPIELTIQQKKISKCCLNDTQVFWFIHLLLWLQLTHLNTHCCMGLMTREKFQKTS